MIELMITVAIVLVALLAVAYSATTGFAEIAFARQRQAATGVANKTMEQVRALPFDTVARGLAKSDLDGSNTACASDKGAGGHITQVGSGSTATYTYTPPGGVAETIPFAAYVTGTTIVPILSPPSSSSSSTGCHIRTVKVGPTTFTVDALISTYKNDPRTYTFRVTVYVGWVSGEQAGNSHQVMVQSLFYSPSGCLSTATHPFAAPCQAYLYATTSASQGHIDVTGTLSGISLQTATLTLAGYSSSLQVEQISAIQGIAQTAGGTIVLSDHTDAAGLQTVSSGSDNDPAQLKPNYLTASAAAQSTQTLTENGNGNALNVTTSGGDVATSTSTTLATSGNACPNVTSVTNVTTSLPCGGSTATQGSDEGVQLAAGAAGLGSAILARTRARTCGLTTCVNRAVTYRFTTTTLGMCPSATGDGCVHTDGSMNIGQVTLAALPSGVLPTTSGSLWDNTKGYVQLTNLTATASAEGGVGSAAPAVTAPLSGTGTLTYWNGSGYSTCTLYSGSCAAGATIPIASVTATGLGATVTMSASLKVGTTATDNGGCTGTCTRASSSASVSSPLLGDITYTVVASDGTTVASLNIHVDLGTLLASTLYGAAPSG